MATDDSTISFTTGGFSDYALVLTGNNTQKEFDFDDGTYFEMDKYLEPVGEANGQTSYNVYLEHAFYDIHERHKGTVHVRINTGQLVMINRKIIIFLHGLIYSITRKRNGHL